MIGRVAGKDGLLH